MPSQMRDNRGHRAPAGTYYAVLNMLSSEAEISSLNPTRKPELHKKIPEVAGKREMAYMTGSIANTFNALCAILCGKNPTTYCFVVDNEKMSEAKAKGAAESGKQVSSNDVRRSPSSLRFAPALRHSLPGDYEILVSVRQDIGHAIHVSFVEMPFRCVLAVP